VFYDCKPVGGYLYDKQQVLENIAKFIGTYKHHW
jgi:hypothetical protein